MKNKIVDISQFSIICPYVLYFLLSFLSIYDYGVICENDSNKIFKLFFFQLVYLLFLFLFLASYIPKYIWSLVPNKTYCFRLDKCSNCLIEWLRAKDLVVGLLLLIEEDPDQDTTQSLPLVLQCY